MGDLLGVAVLGAGHMGADHIRRLDQVVSGARVAAVAICHRWLQCQHTQVRCPRKRFSNRRTPNVRVGRMNVDEHRGQFDIARLIAVSKNARR